jgi:hypothetical protein
MKRVSVFMDVEDPINPLADDAALDFARLFSEVGIRGSFCVTGEKCRTLFRRERYDVIEAFKPHCLGLHTDTHSQHPTTMELLADCDYAEGCRVALETELKGSEAFQRAFDRLPSFWGGAGNTWSPEINSALRELGIPAYSYALTSLTGFAVHEFAGVMALPQALSISEDDLMDDGRASVRIEEVLVDLSKIDQPWIGIFAGHPTRFRYQQFWDFSYALGSVPVPPEFAEPTENDAYCCGMANLETFLKRLRQSWKVVGVDEAMDLPWTFRKPTREEHANFRAKTAQNIRLAGGWPIHRAGLNVERIVSKTMALEGSLRVAALPD